jgi:ABC-type transport system involved in multi-copper enzyme maturation permease subunit
VITPFHLTARLLRRDGAGLIAMLALVALVLLVNPLIADSIGGGAGLESILEALPPALRAFTQTQPEFIAASGLAGFLSVSFTHPVYLAVACVALVGFAARGLAGEMERGTIQLALARPISRPSVYLSRVYGVIAVAVLLSVVGPIGMLIGLELAKPAGEFDRVNFVFAGISTFFLFWSIGGLTLLGSAAADTGGRCVAWATTGLVISYFVDYFASLWDALEPLEPLSILDYFDPGQALVNGQIEATNLIVLGLVGAVGCLAGLVVFVRRDLPS